MLTMGENGGVRHAFSPLQAVARKPVWFHFRGAGPAPAAAVHGHPITPLQGFQRLGRTTFPGRRPGLCYFAPLGLSIIPRYHLRFRQGATRCRSGGNAGWETSRKGAKSRRPREIERRTCLASQRLGERKHFPRVTQGSLSSDLPAAGLRQAGQALKGRHIVAQGNALGASRVKSSNLPAALLRQAGP